MKYTSDVIEAIVDAVSQTGSNRAGWEAGGISKQTFYQWVKSKPDFHDRIARARAIYRENVSDAHRQQALKAFEDYLFGRAVQTTTIEEEGQDEEGRKWKKTITRTVNYGVPKWAIERVLGTPGDVLDALRMLAKAGFIPHRLCDLASGEMEAVRVTLYNAFSGLLPPDDDKEKLVQHGLSESLANEIRRKLLGVSVKTLPAAEEASEDDEAS